MKDDGGAWVNDLEGAEVAEFLTWFTSDKTLFSLRL